MRSRPARRAAPILIQALVGHSQLKQDDVFGPCLVDLMEAYDLRVPESQQKDGDLVSGLALQGDVATPPLHVLGGEDLVGGAVASPPDGGEFTPADGGGSQTSLGGGWVDTGG